ncbi:hypothetical protein [Microbacterium sp. GXF6406]
MASKNTTVETVEAAQFDEAEPIVYAAITRMMEAHGITVQHARYKAMRAIAFQAFVNAIEDGSFDALVDEAIDNAGNLPRGWELANIKKATAPTSQSNVQKAAATRKPRATKGSTVATAEGVVIAEQRHVDAPAAKRTRKPAAKPAPAAKA